MQGKCHYSRSSVPTLNLNMGAGSKCVIGRELAEMLKFREKKRETRDNPRRQNILKELNFNLCGMREENWFKGCVLQRAGPFFSFISCDYVHLWVPWSGTLRLESITLFIRSGTILSLETLLAPNVDCMLITQKLEMEAGVVQGYPELPREEFHVTWDYVRPSPKYELF